MTFFNKYQIIWMLKRQSWGFLSDIFSSFMGFFSGSTTWLCILTSSGYPASSALQRWAAPWTSASDRTSSSPPYCASHRPNLTAEKIPFKNTAWDERVRFIILSCNNSIFIRLHNAPFKLEHAVWNQPLIKNLTVLTRREFALTLEFSGQIFLVLISGSVATNLLHHSILFIWNKCASLDIWANHKLKQMPSMPALIHTFSKWMVTTFPSSMSQELSSTFTSLHSCPSITGGWPFKPTFRERRCMSTTTSLPFRRKFTSKGTTSCERIDSWDIGERVFFLDLRLIFFFIVQLFLPQFPLP